MPSDEENNGKGIVLDSCCCTISFGYVQSLEEDEKLDLSMPEAKQAHIPHMTYHDALSNGRRPRK